MSIKLISIDIKSQFGFLKKIDTNVGIYFTYNIIHKPALLGVLGAVIGLDGIYQAYTKSMRTPEYWEKLHKIKLAVVPLNSKKGLYDKTVVQYNNSVGYASQEQGGNLIIKEQILINPNYRIYLKLDLGNEVENKLYKNLKNNDSVFIPYLGKNDFQLWWNNFVETEDFVENYKPTSKFRIKSIFIKENSETVKGNKPDAFDFDIDFTSDIVSDTFAYFERLPVDFNDLTSNYNLKNFSYTNFLLNPSSSIDGLCRIDSIDTIIQLF